MEFTPYASGARVRRASGNVAAVDTPMPLPYRCPETRPEEQPDAAVSSSTPAGNLDPDTGTRHRRGFGGAPAEAMPEFAANNMRLPNWKDSTDFQSPCLVKLLSSAPLSDDITYCFYATMAEKGVDGEQRSIAPGNAGLTRGARDSDKRVLGLDLAGEIGGKTWWYAQYLWNSWDGFLDADPSQDMRWHGGFAGVDYVHSDRWAFSALYNYADANDFDRTDTIYEGIDMNSLSVTASYYFMRNVKGVIELNRDFLDARRTSGRYWTGHLDQEHYILFGLATLRRAGCATAVQRVTLEHLAHGMHVTLDCDPRAEARAEA